MRHADGPPSAWGPQLRELSEHFRCIAWDMPGYGDSDLMILRDTLQ